MRATHHSSQVVLLHQPEGVLVAGSEVVGLGGAHVVPGHRAHGVDDICRAGRETAHSSGSARPTFKQRLHKKYRPKQKFASLRDNGDAANESPPEMIHSFRQRHGGLERKSITRSFYAICSNIHVSPCPLFPFAEQYLHLSITGLLLVWPGQAWECAPLIELQK